MIQKPAARSSHSEAKEVANGINGNMPITKIVLPVPLIITMDSTSEEGLIIPKEVKKSTNVVPQAQTRNRTEKIALLKPLI